MKIKRLSFLILFLVLYSQVIFAELVPVETAKIIAKNFYYERANSLSINISKENIKISSTFIKTFQQEAVYYIFNINNNKGFVIIAADDRVEPLLAYSFKGSYNETNNPPAFINFMDNYKKQVVFAREKKLLPSKEILNKWKSYSISNSSKSGNSNVKGISPLVSTHWSQGQYYNALCPSDASGPGGHALVGCVAVAMGQIMKYHEFPTQGYGSHSYNHPTYGTLSANFGATTYNWSGMPNSISSHDSDIAVLLYHCGVGVNMSYGASGSGALSANARTAFINYFKYTSSTKIDYKDGYADETWEKLLRIELDASRPLYYAGSNPSTSSAHAFVCDGYQGTNHFHFNWGWGGYADGYYYLTNLNPASNNFNADQHVILVRPTAVGPFCSGQKILTNLYDTLTDGSDTNFYNSSCHCRWWICPPGATSITLNFLSFNTEAGFDYLKIYDGENPGAPVVGNYSGQNLPPSFTSSGGNIYLRFTTDPYVVDEGWSLTYTANYTNVEENNNNYSVNIYPNPSDGNFTFSLSDNYKGLLKLKIIDLTGRELKIFQFEKSDYNFINNFKINKLEAGIYILQVETEKNRIQKRLIIE